MKPSTLPDGIPVLSRGRHRTPRRGACFMEFASVLAGERWSDHPSCTHPVLGQLARQVNEQHQRRRTPGTHAAGPVGRRPVRERSGLAHGRGRGRGNSHSRRSRSDSARAVRRSPPSRTGVRRRARSRRHPAGGSGRARACSRRSRLGRAARGATPHRHEHLRQACAPTMIRCAVDGVVGTAAPTVTDGCARCWRRASPLVPSRIRGPPARPSRACASHAVDIGGATGRSARRRAPLGLQRGGGVARGGPRTREVDDGQRGRRHRHPATDQGNHQVLEPGVVADQDDNRHLVRQLPQDAEQRGKQSRRTRGRPPGPEEGPRAGRPRAARSRGCVRRARRRPGR